MLTRYHYTLIALCCVIAIDGMGVGLIWPLFGQLFIGKAGAIVASNTSAQVRDILYGITLAIFNVGLLLGAPLLGDLSDHIGRKKVLLIGLFGTCISYGICTLSIIYHNVWLLFSGRLLTGILAGCIALAQAAIVDISGKEHKMVNLSLLALANEVGFIAGPLLGGLLIDKNLVSFFSLTTPFVAAILLAFANGMFLLFTFRETFTPSSDTARQIKWSKGWDVFVAAFMRRDIRRLSTVYLCLNFGYALYFQFVVIYLIHMHHYTGAKVGYFLSSITVVAALSFLWLVRLAKKYFSLNRTLIIFSWVAALGIGLTFWQKEIVAWICIVPFSIGTVLAYMAALTLFSETVGPDEQGWIMGVSTAICAVGWGGSAIVAGLIGNFHTPIAFLLASAILVVGTMIKTMNN